MIELLMAGFGTSLMWLCFVVLAVMCVSAFGMVLARMARRAGRRIGRRHTAALAILGVMLAFYGGSKHIATITFPYTDFEMRYLVDNGSYVTNDFIHVDFRRIVAPTSAEFFISYRDVASTNDTDWIVFTNTTFAAFAVPSDIQFPAATNYNWICYTTWTPGPSVQTNGVWHAYWGRDGKSHTHLIPVRTAVRRDGETIATPKSKREASK